MSTLLVSLQSIGQNRISTWDKDKITNVKIEIQENGKIEKSVFYNDKGQIDKIFDFLESIEFKEIEDSKSKNQFTEDSWTSRFIFRGHSDWVLFFDDHATIGKTSFQINKNLNSKVKKLIDKLEQEQE